MTYNGKGEYQGYWENNRKHGEGVFNYPNGDNYTGWWRFGEKEGTGTYYSAQTNMKLVGEWKKSEIVSGTWVMPNGTVYSSSFQNNKPIGRGKWQFKNGNETAGEFTQKVKERGEDEEEPPAEGEDG